MSRADLVERNHPVMLYFYHLWVIVEMETVKILKDPTEMASRSLQPALWLLIFGEAFNRLHAVPTGGMDYLSFLTPGILAQSITFVSIFNGLSIIWEKDMGLMQKLLSTPIRHSSLVLGKMLASTSRSITQVVVILALALLLRVPLQWGWGRLAGLLLLTVLGSALFSGFSMVIASIVRTRDRMMGIGQLVTMPLFFASSALYPIAIMPPWLQAFSKGNPLTYLVEGLRALLLGTGAHPIGMDVAILGGAAGLMWWLATLLYPSLLY